MKKIIYTIGVLALPFLFISCFSTSGEKSSLEEILAPTSSVKYNVVNINDQYSMKVPDFMTVTTQLQPDASLQYNNPFKGKYVIVLDEDREEIKTFLNDYGIYDDSKPMLENYVDARLSFFKESGVSVKEETELKSKMVNGRKAYSIELDVSVPEIPEDVAYFFTYIEGEDHFYMIMAWTLLSRKDAYKEEAKEMADSFKEF